MSIRDHQPHVTQGPTSEFAQELQEARRKKTRRTALTNYGLDSKLAVKTAPLPGRKAMTSELDKALKIVDCNYMEKELPEIKDLDSLGHFFFFLTVKGLN